MAFNHRALLFDMAPHTWIAERLTFSESEQGVLEDTLKVLGIGFYATYFVRASASAVWAVRGPERGGPDRGIAS